MPSVFGRGDIRAGHARRKLGDAAVCEAVSFTDVDLAALGDDDHRSGDARFFRIRGLRLHRPAVLSPIRCGVHQRGMALFAILAVRLQPRVGLKGAGVPPRFSAPNFPSAP